ncbi:MAG: hypothetical protein R3C59_25005 [Planctomycetaceae bacterium]
MTRRSTLFLLGLSLIFALAYSRQRLWHSDLWDHINYGQLILQTRSLPETEPLLPLAAETPMINAAWGAQVLMATVYQTDGLGLAALQFGHGLMVVLALATVGRAIWVRSDSVTFAVLGFGICLGVNWQQWLIIRPQLFGVLFYNIVLLVCFTSVYSRTSIRWLLPVLSFVWANLHGSWAMGLTLIAGVASGHGLDVLWRVGSIRRTLGSRSVRRMFLLLSASAVAVLLNPYGTDIYRAVVQVGRHPNITSMYEWAPLTLNMRQGQASATVFVALTVVLCLSPKRRRAAELLPLFGMAVLTLWSSRMINWFAPLAAFVLTTHAAALWRRWTRRPKYSDQANASDVPNNSCRIAWVVILVMTFMTSPWGQQTMLGRRKSPDQLLSIQTPVKLGRAVAVGTATTDGIVLAPAEWSGYLSQVSNQKLKLMVNLHVHLIPPAVWADYLALIRGDDEWQERLRQYKISTVITSKATDGRLIQRLTASDRFCRQYEDNQAVVFALSSSPDSN